MAFLKEDNYKNLALILLERIGRDEFFNGTILCEGDNITITVRMTLIVYRDKIEGGCGDAGIPSDIKPVWWECEVVKDGTVVPNDFSWCELIKFLPVAVTPSK